MEINKINNLLELFYYQYQNQNEDDIFLESLKNPKKKIFLERCLFKILLNYLKKFLNILIKGDRCLY